MMNSPWYDPATIDWQDGLNPLAIPAYRERRNKYVYQALQNPTMVELRAQLDVVPTMYAKPDPAFQSLAASVTFDDVILLPSGSWIVGLSASSQQAAGFLAQITMPTGETLFNKPIKSADLTNALPLWLSHPTGVPDAGAVKVRLINLALATNVCQLCLWVVEP